jgi:hypothetical protein
MAEYKITQVSAQPPREWVGPKGTVYYIKVRLEGHAKPVSIGKKSPDALHVGDTVYGTITEDGMHDEDKFKSEQNPNYGGGSAPRSTGGGGKTFDEKAMYVSYAKDIAVALMNQGIIPGTNEFTDYMLYASGAITRTANVLYENREELTQEKVDSDVAAAIDMFTKESEEGF